MEKELNIHVRDLDSYFFQMCEIVVMVTKTTQRVSRGGKEASGQQLLFRVAEHSVGVARRVSKFHNKLSLYSQPFSAHRQR